MNPDGFIYIQLYTVPLVACRPAEAGAAEASGFTVYGGKREVVQK